MSTLSYSAEVANTTLPLSKWEPSYVKSPDGRGTIELLTSCLLTYIACIWTAVHPNILPYRSERSYLWYKIAWAVGSIAMPEFVIGTAIIQRRESRRILKEWKVHFGATDSEDLNNSTRPTIIDEENIPPKPKKGADWLGKSGAFLVISGGFFIKQPINVETSATGRSADSDATTVNSNSVITSLTAEGFLMLLKANVFDKLIEDGKLTQDNFHWRVFEDKGKADNVSSHRLTTLDFRSYDKDRISITDIPSSLQSHLSVFRSYGCLCNALEDSSKVSQSPFSRFISSYKFALQSLFTISGGIRRLTLVFPLPFPSK